ncbi:MAG TPA: tetratricopeptide repeat protein [Planctomycetota bacterium]|nr:tetratricopeptide repeat protein [Planctomycetota bacterium]
MPAPTETTAPPDDAPTGPAPGSAPRRARRERRALVVFGILLLSFVLYAPSIGNDFTWDDRFAAMGDGPHGHPLVAHLRPLGDYFASNWWPHHDPGSQAYRPLTTLWFALRHALCGDSAVAAHLANVLLHTATVGLCWLWLRRLGASTRPAALGSLVYGLHAIHSEAVANLVGGAELLALAFGLGACLVLQAGHAAGRRRFVACAPFAALLLFAAAASKESGLAWVAFAPLCVLVPALHRGRSWTSLRGDVVVLAATAAVPATIYLLLRAHMLANLPGGPDAAVGLLENPLLGLPAPARVASGVLVLGYGLLLTLLPLHLSVDYGPSQLPVVTSMHDAWLPAAIGAAAVLAAAVVLGLRNRRRRPFVCLAAACFFGFSLMTSNVLFPSFTYFAERSFVTPSLALALLAAWAARVRASRTMLVFHTVLGLWCVASVATALPRNFVFADDATLVLAEVESSPRSVRLQLCAAMLHERRGHLERARQHLRTAAALAPDLPQPWLELAALALRQGHADEARGCLQRAWLADAGERRRCGAMLQELTARLAAASPR